MKRTPGWNQHQIDEEAILLRAYGNNTAVLIDREREARSHSQLANCGLAPDLLARFNNGLLYRFIEGSPCTPEDLRRHHVWPATARRLGQWHAILPVSVAVSAVTPEDAQYETLNALLPGKPIPNVWTVMRRWIDALPTGSLAERKQKASLEFEVEDAARKLSDTQGLTRGNYIMSHCDLLSGNVIMHPDGNEAGEVSFIDYEYATPAPAAFDLANHFAEWGGFECDYSVLPTRPQRRAFVREYIQSYRRHAKSEARHVNGDGVEHDSALEADVETLMAEVDAFRGIPGLYWGIWALVQAMISQIDFDYANYAPVRLREYFDWKAETDKCHKQTGKTMSPREERWAQET